MSSSQLGIAVIDALVTNSRPHIHSQMTAELEQEMDQIAEGKTSKEVGRNSRNLLARSSPI